MSGTQGIPLAETASFRAAARRTTALQLVLALALAAAGGAALVASSRLDVGETSVLGPSSSGVVVLDLSSSIDAAPPREVAGVLRNLVESGGQAGLVLFSDVAYEALPPSASTEELRPYLRYFRSPPGLGQGGRDFVPAPRLRNLRFVTPWTRSFRGGTRISSGLEVARRMVSGPTGGGKDVILVSDLNDSLFDVSALSTTLLKYKREGIRLRIVPLRAAPENRGFFARRLGRAAFVDRAELQDGPAGPPARATTGETPRALVALVLLVAALLGLNELWCGRLSWRRA